MALMVVDIQFLGRCPGWYEVGLLARGALFLWFFFDPDCDLDLDLDLDLVPESLFTDHRLLSTWHWA